MHPRQLAGRGVRNTFAIALGVGISLTSANAVASDGVSEIEVLDTLALEENQSLAAFDVRVEEARLQASFEENRLPEPVFEYMLDLSVPGTGHFTTGHMVRIMQMLPRPGARERRAGPARASQEVARAQKRAVSADLLRDIRLDVVELARIEARLELIEDEVGLIDDAIGLVEELAGLGRAEHGELLQLELAREAALDRRSELRSSRRERRAALAGRLGVDTAVIDEVDIGPQILEDWLIDLPSRDELLAMAQENEPRLSTYDAEMAVAAAQVELVEEQNRPWPSIMVGYSNMPPMWEMGGARDQMIQVGFSIPLPIFGSQYDDQASQWQASQQALEQDRSQREQSLAGEVDALLAGWNADYERLNRHERELLPLAGDLARQVLIGVELGQRSAAEFILAVQQEIEVEGRIIELRAGLLEQLVELQRFTGGAIGADQDWAYPQQVGVRQ